MMREFLPNSPFVGHVGIELERLEDGHARLRLPFRDEVVTIGRVVHGGAIATLIDTAAMAAAWAGAEVPEQLRGATVALSITYLAPADGQDVIATAQVLRRGRRLVNVQVEVATVDGDTVAVGTVTYQLG
ncbi:MAG: PaaI family thioesterase [Actinobacteria bacterium]|nr:PaaI family thioesterase [Actinomycetota bacterium]